MNGRPQAIMGCSAPRQSISARGKQAGRNSRDPRPVGDKAYATQCARNVVDFLAARGFGRTIFLDKFLREPMTKDFFEIFKFLIAQLDPLWEVEGKLEDEVPVIMRRLHYPVEVNRSKLQSICGPNTWPQLLAVLDWLIALIQVNDGLIQPAAECNLDLADDTDLATDHHMLRTLHENYLQFLSGKDDDSVEQRLRQVYEERLNAKQFEVEQLQDQNTDMEKQLHEFRSEHDRLLETQAAPRQLEIEADRLRHEIQAQDARVERAEEESAAAEADDHTLLGDIEALQLQARELQEQVDRQAYSKLDIQRLKGERTHLRTVLQDLKKDFEHAEQKVWELGIEESRLEETIGRTVRCINERVEAADSLMGAVDGPSEQELIVQVDVSEPTDVLATVDFKGQSQLVENAGQALNEAIRREEAAAHEVGDGHRMVLEELNEKEKTVRRLKVRLDELARQREEYRVWSVGELDDARLTAEAVEDGVRAAEIGTAGPSVRETAEVDELRLRLSELRSQCEGDRTLMEEKIRREQEVRELHQNSVQREMRVALEAMEQLQVDVDKKVAELAMEPKDADIPVHGAPMRGGC